MGELIQSATPAPPLAPPAPPAANFVHAITLNNFLDFFHFWRDCWLRPIDYLIRYWSIFLVILALNFQGQIWKLLYLNQKLFDCHETESKHIDWILGLMWPSGLTLAMTLTLNFQGQMRPWHLTTREQGFPWSNFKIASCIAEWKDRFTLNKGGGIGH